MPYFSYKARNARGELLQGVMEGADSGAVANQLSSAGAIPVQITLTRGGAAEADRTSLSIKRWFGRSVKPMDVQLFSRQIYTLLKSGVPIMRGLAGLQESAINPAFGRVLKDLRESLDAGRELSVAMRRHPKVFSEFYLSMVRVGEMTGRLDEVFLRLFEHMEFEREMRARVKSATRYPIFVICAMVLAIAVVNIFVIPQFVKVFESFHAELPLMTRMLIAGSRFTVDYWMQLLFVAISAVLVLRSWIASREGRYRWDRFKLKFPIAGKIILKATLARFARSYALSSRSGVPIVQALTVVSQTVDNSYLCKRVERMRDSVERGDSILRTSIAAKVFTPVVIQMIAVGEESGSLDELMEEVAQMYEREVDYELKTLAAQIEPILITFLGVLVLVLALGIFVPIWDLGKVAIPH
ncbi:type II secretion system F family protein [Pseudoduganella danionis]|uniref:type II secretion system F family protein n=1 Tax=Pseudoduganella danionis TaxID=1890295 RepID=UPI0035B029BE